MRFRNPSKKRRQSFRVTLVREKDGWCHWDIRCQDCGMYGITLEGCNSHAKRHMAGKDHDDWKAKIAKEEAVDGQGVG